MINIQARRATLPEGAKAAFDDLKVHYYNELLAVPESDGDENPDVTGKRKACTDSQSNRFPGPIQQV